MRSNSIVPSLMQPLSIDDLKLRNRTAMAPMTRARAGADRIPNDSMTEYYAQRQALILS